MNCNPEVLPSKRKSECRRWVQLCALSDQCISHKAQIHRALTQSGRTRKNANHCTNAALAIAALACIRASDSSALNQSCTSAACAASPSSQRTS
jgi:hypothetical protein